MTYRIAGREHTYVTDRRAALLDFVTRFVAETGYGATADWIWLNVRIESRVSQYTLHDDLNLLTQRGRLTRLKQRSGKSLTYDYFPNEETHA